MYPLFALTGSTNDITYFYFWQPVYFRHGESTIFLSESKESHGRFVGIAEHVGHAMSFKVLANDSQKVLFCSAICSAIAPGEQNLQVDPLGGEAPTIMKLTHDRTQMPFDPGGQDPDSPPTDEEGTKLSQLPMFHPSDLVGHTFLLDQQEDGQWFRTHIVEALEDHDARLLQKPEWVQVPLLHQQQSI